MLLNLRIRDFAIIDAVELALPEGFTVVTGETGTGKSILVDALVVALGGRANAAWVRTGAASAEVEALFDISQAPLVQARLQQRQLQGDDPHLLLIRRVLGVRGRSKVVINGHLANLATLTELVRGLVDISGQHEQQSLLALEQHAEILDTYAQLGPDKKRFQKAWAELRHLQQTYDTLQTNTAAHHKHADFLRFQVEEIQRIGPSLHEDHLLYAEQERLNHADKLKHASIRAESFLYGEDGSALDKVDQALVGLEPWVARDPQLQACCEMLGEARRHIEESARFLRQYAAHVEVDPQRLEEVGERLDGLQRLCRKHGGTLEAVLERWTQLSCELESLASVESHLQSLEEKIAVCRQAVIAQGRALSQNRKTAALRFNQAIIQEVADMDLQDAVFVTQLKSRGPQAGALVWDGQVMTAQGMDEVEFLWSANRGEAPRPLARIASGGELSRLMLAVKRILCHQDLVSVYVFDEVDTGLGGQAAESIGRKIQAVARNHQAIAITHLAPIAVRADYHLRVRKDMRKERTISLLEPVEGVERTEEIARMMGGASVSKATRHAAQAMLDQAQGELGPVPSAAHRQILPSGQS